MVRALLDWADTPAARQRLYLATVAAIKLGPMWLVLFGQIFRGLPAPQRTAIWVLMSAFVGWSYPLGPHAVLLNWSTVPLLVGHAVAAITVTLLAMLPLLVVPDFARMLDTLRQDRSEIAGALGDQAGALSALTSYAVVYLFLRLSLPTRWVATVLHDADVFALPAATLVVHLAQEAMAFGVSLVVPVLAVAFVLELSFGIASRATSGLPIHFVAQPLRQWVTVFAFVLVFPTMLVVIGEGMQLTLAHRRLFWP